jgi:hypothetical protein
MLQNLGFCGLFLAASLCAQTDDWHAVQQIPWGSHIAIKTDRGARLHCEFDHASDRELFCDVSPAATLFPQRLLHRSRDHIRQVRLENPGKGTVRGALAGALLGAVIAAAATANSQDPETRAVSPEFGALIGGIAGAVVGRLNAPHGPIVYQHP